MGRYRQSCILFFLFAFLSVNCVAQATTPTASRRADLQLGGGFAYGLSSDYGTTKVRGFKLYGTYDFRTHLGVDFTFNQLNSNVDDKVYERTYEIGPRYVLHYGNWNPYARVAYGRGVFNFPADIANLAYNISAVGAGVDYNLRTHINLRAEYEYQDWFSFPLQNLKPQVISIGAAYHF